MAKMNTETLVESVIGMALVVYLVAYSLPNAFQTIADSTTNASGWTIAKILIPLVVVFAIVIRLFKQYKK